MREEFFSTCPICGTTYNLEIDNDCPHCHNDSDEIKEPWYNDNDYEDDFLEFESEE